MATIVRENGKKRKWAIGGAATVAVLMAVIAIRSVPPYLAARKELAAIRSQQERLSQGASELADNEEYYKSTEYQERIARLEYNYKKPDEHVVYVYDRAPAVPVPVAPDKKSWLDYLKEKLGL